MVCVSDQDGEIFDVKAILCKILELVTHRKLDGSSTMELVQNRFQDQLRGQKFFLVLDDVWNEDLEYWLALKKFLMLGRGGSRIVITTRSETTSAIIGDVHAYKLQGLSQEDSWQLFKMSAFSHHNLASSLKSCFSYCAVFPMDHVIEKDALIKLWMAQGYIVPLEGGQSIDDAAEEHFVILLRRCFFQDVKKNDYGDIVSIKIHDLMHDVAKEVGREEVCVVTSMTNKMGDKVRHVQCVGDICPEMISSSNKIRSYISIASKEPPVDTLINKWMCLRALNLSKSHIEILPDSIGKLLHLRFLELSHNSRLKILPAAITRLHNLQTLNLRNFYSLRELPKDFSKLVNLQILLISDLKMFKGWWKGEPSVDVNHGLNSRWRFPSVSRLSICKCPNLTSIPHCPRLEMLDLIESKKFQILKTADDTSVSVKLWYLRTNNASIMKSVPTNSLTYLCIKVRRDREIENESEVVEAFQRCASSLPSLPINEISRLNRLAGGTGLQHFSALEEIRFVSSSPSYRFDDYEEQEEDDNIMLWKSFP